MLTRLIVGVEVEILPDVKYEGRMEALQVVGLEVG